MSLLTRKALAYTGLAALFLITGLALRSWQFALFIVPILFLTVLSGLSRLPTDLTLTIRRVIDPQRTMGGEDVKVRVTVRNESGKAIRRLHLEDGVPEQFSISAGMNRLTLDLAPGEAASFAYKISSPSMGHYKLGPTYGKVYDPIGLRFADQTLEAYDWLSVLPRIETIGVTELKPRHVGAWPGMIPARRSGVGSEFYSLREYTPGDELRRVNWKASARSRVLITNDFESEKVTDIALIVDSTERAGLSLFGFDFLDYSVRAAASLANLLLQQGNRVSLILYGPTRTWISPAFGKRQLIRILNQLAEAKPGASSLPLSRMVESLKRFLLPSRSQAIFISPLMQEEIPDVIKDLAVGGYSVLTITPTIKESPSGFNDEPTALAKRILTIERENVVSYARRFSTVLEVASNIPLRLVLHQIRRHSPRLRI